MGPGNSPNTQQKRWMEEVRALGSIVSGQPAVIHHPAGRTAKHNKVHIGHWWLIPLTDDEHKLLHRDKDTFECLAMGMVLVGRWDCEKWLFNQVVQRIGNSTNQPDLAAYSAIMDYTR